MNNSEHIKDLESKLQQLDSERSRILADLMFLQNIYRIAQHGPDRDGPRVFRHHVANRAVEVFVRAALEQPCEVAIGKDPTQAPVPVQEEGRPGPSAAPAGMGEHLAHGLRGGSDPQIRPVAHVRFDAG